jgi:aspartate/methionine/tyrosine aminotransferase
MSTKTKWLQTLESGPKTVLGEGFATCAFNPSIINLGTAENRLLADHFCSLLRDQPDQIPSNLTYQASTSDLPLRQAIASLYEDYFGLSNVNPENFVFGCGICFLVERLGLVLCNPGDVILIPKPCYGAFEPDLVMSRAKVVYIDLNNLPPAPPPEAKMLLLTNPGNPIGDEIANQAELLQWAYQVPDLHVISDDVYALSNRKGAKYQSIAGREDAEPDRVHHLYGISKDWALAGVHVGFFWTRYEPLYKAMKLACEAYRLPSDTVFALTKLYGNKELRDRIIQDYKKRLIEAERITLQKLTDGGFSFVSADNSLFVMLDLRDIAGESEEAELAVWRELLHKHKIHLLPGVAGFHCDDPGWFRICFAAPSEELSEGLDRLIRAVTEIRARPK